MGHEGERGRGVVGAARVGSSRASIGRRDGGNIKVPLEGREAYRASAMAKQMGRFVHLLMVNKGQAIKHHRPL